MQTDVVGVAAVRGIVGQGDRRGREIGFPTVNLALDEGVLKDGVWAGWIERASGLHLAAISIGSRPTFYALGGVRLLEAHLLDFGDEIYGEEVTAWVCQWIRPQRRFRTVDSLVSRLALDIAATRVWAAAG